MTFGVQPTDTDPVRRLIRPIAEAGGWMKLIAVMAIIGGAVYAITIVGLLVAWIPIWIGVLLWQAAERARDAQMTGDEQTAIAALGKVRTVFVIYGVMMLIGIIVGVLMLVLVLVVGVGSSMR